MQPGQTLIALGPARLVLTPLEVWQWQEAAQDLAGPASLCLALLPQAGPAWQGVELGGFIDPPADPGHLALLPAAALPLILPVLCPPWLTEREAQELEEFSRCLQALTDYPGLDCQDCREQEARGEGQPDCAACPRPALPGHSQGALALYPLLGGLAPAAQAGLWPSSLPARQQRLLALRLAIMHDLLARPGGPALPEP